MVFKSLQQPEDLGSLPGALEVVLDTLAVPVPNNALRAIAAALLPDREVTAQGIGRVASYEEESFRRKREGAPRFSWVLMPDGTAARPRTWARGSWRLARRIATEDAVGNWNVTLSVFLASGMAEGNERSRDILGKVALQTASRVLGPFAVHDQRSPSEWASLQAELLEHQVEAGPEAPTAEQNAAARELEERELTPFSLFFGASDALPRPTEELPTRLRLARAGEGKPFDRLVMDRAAGDEELGREVLAYLQEWGWLVDTLGRNPSLTEYAERWQTDLASARERNNQFVTLFPSEKTPERIWNLLWGGEIGQSFVRLVGRYVVEGERSPTVINRFVNSLAFELREAPGLAQQVLAEIATFEESGPIDGSRELRRFFALCERARIWCVQALSAAEEPVLSAGLLSIESVIEERSASYVEQKLGGYRQRLPEGPARELLLAAQKALRVAATLDALDPPASTDPYLQGVEWAAKALAVARSPKLGEPKLVEEARSTVRALDAVY